jgi:hypothetical protein
MEDLSIQFRTLPVKKLNALVYFIQSGKNKTIPGNLFGTRLLKMKPTTYNSGKINISDY